MAFLLFGTFIALILLRVPVSFAIGAAVIAAFLTSDFSTAIQIVPQQILEGVNKPSLTAVPFFIMAGNLMNATGVTDRIFNFANALVGHFRAGLAQVNILSSMIFAGISGAAVADCAGLGSIEIKAMKERGYQSDFAAAVTVTSSIIGPLIPPSIGLVIYAFLAQQSIDRMFLAGIVPGVLVGLSLMIWVRLSAGRNDFPSQPRAPFKTVAHTGLDGSLALLAPAIILGSIMTGVVTATEAGVLACIYCIALGLYYRELTWSALQSALTETAMMTSVIMIIIGFSIAMGWLLAIERVPQDVADWIFALTENKNIFLTIMIVFVLLIGTVVEGVPAKLILVPTLLPVVDAYGIDRVHFGIVLQLALLIGIATPPMGIGLYIVSEVGRVSFDRVALAVLPLLVPLVITLFVLAYVPALSTFLPDLILGPDVSITK